MTIPVTLRRSETALREPCAWFISGTDPRLWLEEAVAWPTQLEAVRFLIVSGPDGRTPAGALLIPPDTPSPRVSGKGQPYGLVGGNLYLPVDAVIDPPLSPAELAATTGDHSAVFHPTLGMVSFARSDERFAWHLLCAPNLSAESWNAAQPGPPARPTLQAVRLAVSLKLEDLFGPENADIASEPPDLLPPSVDEPRDTLPARLARTTAEALIKTIMGLTRHVPRTRTAPTWINSLENWAGRYLSGLNTDLDRIRHKELRRLLDLLERNPLEGLRHSISLSALAHRGRAQPSAQLGRRNLDFNLGRLGGGHLSDGWNVPADIQNSLAQKYRDLASREMKLGRHRRAACIYAELLGDLPTAASALKDGRHFREAAVLYQERLNNPTAAAECLASGGLWHEAIALYEKTGQWLPAADLYARLEDRAAEHACIRREVDRLIAAANHIAAARLVDSRLGETDRALVMLNAQWPDGPQAIAALEEQNYLLERHGRHQELETLVSSHLHLCTPPTLLAGFCGTMAQLARTTHHAGVRHAAIDLVRIKAAEGLQARNVSSADELRVLKALTQLAPSDRLLTRDTQRFRAARGARDRAAAAVRPRAESRQTSIQDGGRLALPDDTIYAAAIGGPNGFFAIGSGHQGTVAMVCGSWAGRFDVLTWPDPAPTSRDAFVFEPHQTSILVARPYAQGLEEKPLPHSGVVPALAGRPTWFPADVVCASSSRYSVWLVRLVVDRVLLDCYHHGKLASTRDVTDALTGAGATAGPDARLSLNAQGGQGHVALGYGRHLLTIENQREMHVVDLGAEIRSLLTAPGRMPGWVVLLERGAIHVSTQHARQQTEIDSELHSPLGCFTEDGRLVLMSHREGRVWQSAGGDPRSAVVKRFDIPSSDAVAMARSTSPESFAVFTRRGGVFTWRLTS